MRIECEFGHESNHILKGSQLTPKFILKIYDALEAIDGNRMSLERVIDRIENNVYARWVKIK